MTDTHETWVGRGTALLFGCGLLASTAMAPGAGPVSALISVATAQEASAAAPSASALDTKAAPAPAAPAESAASTPATATPAPNAPALAPTPAAGSAANKKTDEAQQAAAAIEKKRQESLAKARNMTQLMDRALGGRESLVLGKAKEPEKPATPKEPATPSASALQDVVKVLAPAVRACAQGQAGLAEMDIVVYRDGHVSSAKVTTPPFFQTPAGQCMEGVVRRAQFPRFTQHQFRVTVPFALK